MLRKNPKDYRGTKTTSHSLGQLLPEVMQQFQYIYKERGDLVIALWPQIIGPQFATMTTPLSFRDGLFTVSVRDSTLYSLLNQYEKVNILKKLREHCPHIEIKAVQFRRG